MERVWHSARGGWRLVGADPVRILVATGGVLLVQVLYWSAIQQLALHMGLWQAGVGLAGLLLVRWLLAVPLHATVLARGAGVLGVRVTALARVPSLAVVGAVQVVASAVAAGVLGVLPWLAAAWLLYRGHMVSGTLALALGAVLAWLGDLVVRSSLAYAPVEAVAGRSGPVRALQQGVERASEDLAAVLAITLVGDLVLFLGLILGGLGALPAWPWPRLAVLHRWNSAVHP